MPLKRRVEPLPIRTLELRAIAYRQAAEMLAHTISVKVDREANELTDKEVGEVGSYIRNQIAKELRRQADMLYPPGTGVA